MDGDREEREDGLSYSLAVGGILVWICMGSVIVK